MSEIYLKRLKEFASIDAMPALMKEVEIEISSDSTAETDKAIAYIKNIMDGDGSELDQNDLDIYYTFKFINFHIRFFLALMEIEAYYKIESVFDYLKDIRLPKESLVGINGIFDILRTLPDYYYIPLMKLIDNSGYYQEELIDSIVQGNKKEFVEIIRSERYDINSLSNICSLYKRMLDEIERIKSTTILNASEEDFKKISNTSGDYIQAAIGEEAAQVYQSDTDEFYSQIRDEFILRYWQEQNRYTTTEKNILENIIDDIRVTPQYIALYNEYHKDGVFYPDGVDITIESVEMEDITNSLPQSYASSTSPINRYDRYEGEVPLYYNYTKDKSLKLDRYYTKNIKRVMTLFEALSNIGYIDNNEINSFYTHFTGLGGSYIVSKKLHWRGKFTDLCFVIFMLYPDQCYDAIRYEPIKEHIEYQHNEATYNNGTNFASAATRPSAKFKRFIRNLYVKENEKPIKAQKLQM